MPLTNVQNHKHNGIDNERINPSDLLGFPIFTTAPTHNALEGTIVLGLVGGVYKLYARINKTWKSVTLT